MYLFKNDYSEMAHPRIIQKMTETNMNQTFGYGEDEEFTKKTISMLKKHMDYENCDIYFFVGGTQTNLTSIGSFLKPFEAVISIESGHICTHETGAIELTGHRILSAKGKDGKLYPDDVLGILKTHSTFHMVKPRMVYISNSTEIGTTYTKDELKALSDVCKQNDLLLFLDGARLGSALVAKENNLTMNDVAQLTDAFYIGGTKNGAMFGEALIITNDSLKPDFKFNMKQRGAILAKGRLLSIQFMVLFEDGLFYELAEHSNNMAKKIQDGFVSLGCELSIKTNSNQVFVILNENVVQNLKQFFEFEHWEDIDDTNSVYRFVTSWATDENQVDNLIDKLREILI